MHDQIYQLLRKIPKGKVVSYKTMAEYFSTSPRAIGKIMNCNNDPETFPCYKVVRSDGQIGGYCGSDEKMIQEKIRRLDGDGIHLIDGRIPAGYFRIPDSLKKGTK